MRAKGSISDVCITVLALSQIVNEVVASKCATLYNSANYQGYPVSISDGSKEPYQRHLNYVPRSVRVNKGCFLTIYDIYGNRQTLDRDFENLQWSPHNVLDASCCDCDGCIGAANKLDGLCARLFENQRCDSCSGFRLDFKIGDEANSMGPVSNRMTSVAVRPECTLTVFSRSYFQGWRFNITTSNNMLGENWHKQISSAKCGCDESTNPPIGPSRTPITLPTFPTMQTSTWAPITLPTVPTKRPPMTLPTVPTTRPPMTLPTVPTTRPPMTLPTVPTTRPPMTLPTVPTTRPPMTLPTVPTTRPPMTLPTVPTTTGVSSDSDYDDDDGFFGGSSFEDALTTTTTDATTDSFEGFESSENDNDGNGSDSDAEVDVEEEDEDDSWEDFL